MFSRKTLDFLVENRLQDSKEWFEAHKPQFVDTVINPLIELTNALTPTMLEVDNKLICDPKVGKCISRVYRDTRFSHDKSRYRDVMWIIFMRDKKLYDGLPGFFFEISPNGFRYGCGYYQASNTSMDKMRQLILDGDKDFKKALACYEKQDVFNIEGDLYKRSKFPDCLDNLKVWLDRKSIYFAHNCTNFDLLFSNKLAERLCNDLKSISPVYDFLMKIEAEVQKR